MADPTSPSVRPAESATVPTPIGPFTIVVNAEGAVLASGFAESAEPLLPLIVPSFRPETTPRVRPELGAPTRAVAAFLNGDLAAIDDVVVWHAVGGEFLTSALTALRTVAPGRPVSYADFAELTGRPTAVRAVAQACARNPAALFVPCHRVLRSDGSIGGYRWGSGVKRWLLDFEHLSTRPPARRS